MIIAVGLGRPVQHEDVHKVPLKVFMAENVKRRGFIITQEVSKISIPARLDAGRWLADCPCGCGGAELVSEKTPLFLCGSCGSEGKWWPVVFPTNRGEIEAEIVKRSEVNAWAWNPGELLTKLKQETKRLAGEK